MPSFFPVVRTSNGRFVYDDVHLTDEGAFEHWRFNREGLCLKTLRRLVQLWLEALIVFYTPCVALCFTHLVF